MLEPYQAGTRTKRMAEYERRLNIAKRVAAVLAEEQAGVSELAEIFSIAQKQLTVSLPPEDED